jgi:hypothetical protein
MLDIGLKSRKVTNERRCRVRGQGQRASVVKVCFGRGRGGLVGRRRE